MSKVDLRLKQAIRFNLVETESGVTDMVTNPSGKWMLVREHEEFIDEAARFVAETLEEKHEGLG